MSAPRRYRQQSTRRVICFIPSYITFHRAPSFGERSYERMSLASPDIGSSRQGPRRYAGNPKQIHLFTQQWHERTSTPPSSWTWATSVQSGRCTRPADNPYRDDAEAAARGGVGARDRAEHRASRAPPAADARGRNATSARRSNRQRRPSRTAAIAAGGDASTPAPYVERERPSPTTAQTCASGESAPPRSPPAPNTGGISKAELAAAGPETRATRRAQIAASGGGPRRPTATAAIEAIVADRGDRGGDGGFQDRRNGGDVIAAAAGAVNAVEPAAASTSNSRSNSSSRQQPVQIAATGETQGWFDAARDAGFIRRPANSYLAEAGDAYVPPQRRSAVRAAHAPISSTRRSASISAGVRRSSKSDRSTTSIRRSRRSVRSSIPCPRRTPSGSCSWRRDGRRRADTSSLAARSISSRRSATASAR